MSATIWYVAYTNPKCEQRAAAALQRVGFETFLPKVAHSARRGHKRALVERTLFPRYLFVGMKPVCTWFDLRNADGVEAVLANEGRPLAIQSSIIAELRNAIAAGGYAEAREACLVEGSRVQIAEGPLQGFEGVCTAVRLNRNVEIVVDLFNRPTIMKMRLDGLINLGPSSATGQPAVQASIR